MIESVEGLESLDAIATVPGVGALFLGAGSDLSRSMGVAANSPEVEAAFQQVSKACKAHKVAFGDHAGPHAARRSRATS
jgi:2-keto-3-deoxy-L-rhamnonate aldolase RhmA